MGKIIFSYLPFAKTRYALVLRMKLVRNVYFRWIVALGKCYRAREVGIKFYGNILQNIFRYGENCIFNRDAIRIHGSKIEKKKERKRKKKYNGNVTTTLEYISRWFPAFKSFTSLSCYFYPFFILHHLTQQSTLPYPPRPRISHPNIFCRVSKKIISSL